MFISPYKTYEFECKENIIVDRKYKDYTLFILRSHFQVRAEQKMLGSDWYTDKTRKDLSLYRNKDCPEKQDPELKHVEKYQISLDITSPTLQDLYSKIKEVCSEFSDKKSFHLYWKYSATKVLPISNYISYLSMVSQIADGNNNLYLVAREWNDNWMRNTAATYVALPEHEVLVNMVSPPQSVFTLTQEYQLNMVKTAARQEFTSTYSPPPPPSDVTKKKEKGGKNEGKKQREKSKSPKKKK